MVEPYLHLNGRRMILTDETEVNIGNVVQILRKALPYHWKNRSEISYLWSYYKGRQPILNRVKEVRPEITNKIVENRANEIVSFKSGYLMGEPLQYVSRGNAENIADAINQLNEFVFAEEKPAKDKELADWFHICGTSFRMVLPDEMAGEDDESPFEIYTLDPRNTFVVYNNGLGNKPILGVKYVVDENGVVHYSCYSDHEYFEIVESKVISYDTHILGEIPIIEYPLNMARIGAFELVIPLLDAINLTDSNRLDGVEQFIQALIEKVCSSDTLMRNLKDLVKVALDCTESNISVSEALKYVKYVKALDPAKITSDTVPYLGNPGRYVELDEDGIKELVNERIYGIAPQSSTEEQEENQFNESNQEGNQLNEDV